MSGLESTPNRHPLADIDQVIHGSARLMVLTYLYVVDSVDYTFLKNMTGLSWGNLATHLGKLEQSGYIESEKTFKGKKPHTKIRLTSAGRAAFQDYKRSLQQVFDELPD